MKMNPRQGAAKVPAAGGRAGLDYGYISGGSRRDIRIPTQSLQSLQIAADFVFPVEGVEKVWTQIPERHLVLEDVVNGDEHGVSHCHSRAETIPRQNTEGE